MPAPRLELLTEVLEPFETTYHAGMAIAYFNDAFEHVTDRTEILKNYCFLCDPTLTHPDRKTFFAERYGGDGILANGGGARCGFDGKLQVKGIGANQLVGRDVERGHADGVLPLDEAIYEAIWGEVINLALPYGAARTIAILDTGLDAPNTEQKLPRALLLREAVVRPAHFMRAIYFKERTEGTLSKDAIRVKRALQRLSEFLPSNDSTSAERSQEKILKNGLTQLSRRFAKQFAISRAKRLLHFNVSASNVCMSGGWLDLSKTTIFSSSLIVDPVTVLRFKREHAPALSSIKDICFYAHKYLGLSKSHCISIVKETKDEFREHYIRTLNFQLIVQFGYPLCLLKDLEEHPAALRFGQALYQLQCHEDFSLTPVPDATQWEGFDYWTAEIYRLIIRRHTEQIIITEKYAHLPDALIDELQDAYEALFNTVFEQHAPQLSARALRTAIIINSTKYSRTPRLLLIDHLIEHTRELAKSARASMPSQEPVTRIIETAIHLARLTLDYNESTELSYWASPSTNISYGVFDETFYLHSTQHDKQKTDLQGLLSLAPQDTEIQKSVSFYSLMEMISE